VSHTVVPFKVLFEAEEGVQNPVYTTEDVCVLCELGTEAKETVELEHVIIKHNQMHSVGCLERNSGVARIYSYCGSLSYAGHVTDLQGFPCLGEEPLASQAKLCPRNQLRVS